MLGYKHCYFNLCVPFLLPLEPLLLSDIDSTHSSKGSLATQIKRRMSKLRINSKAIDDSRAAHEIDQFNPYYLEEMLDEMKKENPSVPKLKKFLDATRMTRKSEVDRLSRLEIINLYPALKIPNLLLWEFTVLIDIPEDILVDRWKYFVDAMRDYLKRTENFTFSSKSYESLTVEILKKMPSIVPSGSRTSGVAKLVLQSFEDNSNVIIPSKSEPPRLIMVGDLMKEMKFFAYVDGCVVFTEKCPARALLLLLATYWVFNIEFAPESRPSFLLISTALLRDKMPKARISKCSAVHCLLQQLKL